MVPNYCSRRVSIPISRQSLALPGLKFQLLVRLSELKSKRTTNGPSHALLPATGFLYWHQELHGPRAYGALAVGC